MTPIRLGLICCIYFLIIQIYVWLYFFTTKICLPYCGLLLVCYWWFFLLLVCGLYSKQRHNYYHYFFITFCAWWKTFNYCLILLQYAQCKKYIQKHYLFKRVLLISCVLAAGQAQHKSETPFNVFCSLFFSEKLLEPHVFFGDFLFPFLSWWLSSGKKGRVITSMKSFIALEQKVTVIQKSVTLIKRWGEISTDTL